jgi:hypothetical protein
MRSFFPQPEYWHIALVVCGILCVSSPRWSLSANLLQDPSFEDGAPRAVAVLDQPWGGEDEGDGNGVLIVRGIARSGSQSARMQASPEAVLWQRFPTTLNTDYTATCWIMADPALGVGGDGPAFSIRRTDVICPVEECDDDGDEDLDHSEAIARVPLQVQTTDWEQITVNFNSGPLTQLAIHFYSVLNGNQFILVDDCSVDPVGSPDPIVGSPDPSGGSCTGRYGSERGFQVCFETGTECGFEAVKDSVQSCDDVCRAGGGQCVRTYGNNSSTACVATSEPSDDCARTNRYDDICVCSL